MKIKKHLQSGFSLVELIVSLAVFSVVITISVGALLTLISTNQKLQIEQSIMTNMSFALDSMTREIRTGTNYYCLSGSESAGLNDGQQIFSGGKDMDTDSIRDCDGNTSNSNYHGISFLETGDSLTASSDDEVDRVAYFYASSTKELMRRIDKGEPRSIISSGVEIVNAEFFVSDTAKLYDSGDTVQPTVTIFIQARDVSDASGKLYNIQTTVTQRTLDI